MQPGPLVSVTPSHQVLSVDAAADSTIATETRWSAKKVVIAFIFNKYFHNFFLFFEFAQQINLFGLLLIL